MMGQVNTLMAGTGAARVKRNQYTTAGYTNGKQSPRLYVAGEPAGSAAENLRDLNLPGYRIERPWHDTPDPYFEGETIARPAYTPVKKRQTKHKGDWVEELYREAKRSKRDVALCILLGAVILTMTVLRFQMMISGVQLQNKIAGYQTQTLTLERDSERLSKQIEQAKNGERIRNLAQNELGMLRPERADTQVIYIQQPALAAQEAQKQSEESKFEALDFALGILEIFE